MLDNLLWEIKANANKEKAEILQRFFKTWKWQYWEGDLFYWIIVPIQRKIVKKYYAIITFEEVGILLKSKYHEERLIWAFILVAKFEATKSKEEKEIIYKFYIKNSKWINNWDLVDLSAPNIVWKYLLDKNKDILYEFSKSNNLWKRRISIIATFTFIKEGFFEDTIKISQILMTDNEDLIHKACWWMLREIWKRNENILIEYLNKNILKIPRTTLRYAIERLEENKRKYYLNLK